MLTGQPTGARLHEAIQDALATSPATHPMISRERDSDLVVADLMTLEPVVVQVTAGIEEAEALMHDRAVSGLPVVDELGDLVGRHQPDRRRRGRQHPDVDPPPPTPERASCRRAHDVAGRDRVADDTAARRGPADARQPDPSTRRSR